MSSLLQLQQRTSLWKSSTHIRRLYSTEALESGFPKPDPKYNETIVAIPRSKSGTNISTYLLSNVFCVVLIEAFGFNMVSIKICLVLCQPQHLGNLQEELRNKLKGLNCYLELESS
ncbi:hypothetical protein CMV_029605 [Castanea mollissima]|uniref:Uncharacterized protein n=1 Tax=Castanea mollissima TaxID=60419 RepID=A0A8J4QE36_9ROSI|nr:hypothetical protein CMV_029605 [Castanea mollissima]